MSARVGLPSTLRAMARNRRSAEELAEQFPVIPHEPAPNVSAPRVPEHEA